MYNVINSKISKTLSNFTSCEPVTSAELIQISGVHSSPRMHTQPISFQGFTVYSSVNTSKSNSGRPERSEIRRVVLQQGGRDSSVGIATRYGLDGPGIESRWGGKTFRTRPD